MSSTRSVARAVGIGSALVLAAVLAGATPASAVCGVVEGEDRPTPSVVFGGTVIARTDDSVTFEVDTVYKGSAFETETLGVTGFSDDPLAFIAVGTHEIVQGDRDPLTGTISVPMCAQWARSSWNESDAHPPASGLFGRVQTHPVSGFNFLVLCVVAALIFIGTRIRTHRRAASRSAVIAGQT